MLDFLSSNATSLLLSALFIFVLRTIDVSLATVRMLMVFRGQKLWAWVLGFIQAVVFVVAISAILTNISNWVNIVGFAGGFATGNVVGMLIEDRMAMGYTHFRIISSRQGPAIADRIREAGYAVTEISGRGKDGTVTLLNCSVQRKRSHKIEEFVQEIDPEAFVTAEDVRPVRRGFWGS
jgi:uncharacterized protein YebE (UPF0316 family)